ncbi:MAG TPA: YHS domain-containing (seleno)protein [Ohtaekwangia sp.]|uniref:YHS domain-containing (seleno)protein n=1 Tax=Ohtaekwangia sp. TaxID=2066019 RepID=UPI002F93238C
MKSGLIIFLLLCSTQLFAQNDAQRSKHFNIKKNIALEGYDAVSYFDNKPVEGKESIRFTHKGITYLFSSQNNLARFKSNPDKYEPAYGGWCAYAMGESGEKVKVDPETFKIIDGKLYLYYNFWGNNTLEDWNKNEAKLKQAGDRNWKNISSE